MHIAIEGMDESGKTSTAKKIAEYFGYEFGEKPLHMITDQENCFDNYMEVIKKVNLMKPEFKSRFYGLANYLVSKKRKKAMLLQIDIWLVITTGIVLMTKIIFRHL